ncbi:MAG TPA: 3-oxoacyl-[acyl-carrier-protein] synthase III C-terminal domain-containing protein [Rhabdochlamydiaceae bacterium]
MFKTISAFQVIRPAFELCQEEIIDWLAAAHTAASKDPERHSTFLNVLKKIGLGELKVKKRGLSIRDPFHQDWDQMEIYPAVQSPEGVGFGKRSQVFDRIACEKLDQLYPVGQQLPSHLIHVTCTGYVAPSPAQRLVSLRQSGDKTVVTHAYHMGCYASIPALRMARGFSEPSDIVHTEICSLHLNPNLHELDQLVVQTLFADGFIKYTVGEDRPGFRVLYLDERIIPDTSDLMHWVCQDWGLKMKLAKDVPQQIAGALPSFVAKLLSEAKVSSSDVYFAIHPGGPKIIQQVAAILGLKPEQCEHSQWVLQNYGNMSSATLPHIWEKLWNDEKVKSGSYVVSLAFGPGLTLAGGVFQCVR